MNKTLIPAYGRDYKSAKSAKADFFDGKDWIIADISDPYDGKPTSIRDFEPGTGITLRYKRLASLTCVKVPTVLYSNNDGSDASNIATGESK